MGKREFTSSEVDKIRHLLQRKARADRSEQKVIRASIRRIGFYISDFTPSAEGFTPSDFDNLVERGEIIITGQHPRMALREITAPIHHNKQEARSRPSPRPDSKTAQKIPPSGTMNFEILEGIKDFGFYGFLPVSNLQETRCKDVPKEPGIYLVLRADKGPPVFLQKSLGGFFKGTDPTVPVKELQDNWVDGPIVVNIGKAGGGGGNATLKGRLKQYMEFGAGKPVGHRGGRYIWQLAGSEKLQVCWMSTPNEEPKAVESRLIQEFKSRYGKRPFANLQG